MLHEVLRINGTSLTEANASGQVLLTDGTHAPTRNQPASGLAKANYSGKHKAQCLNIQVASTLEGDLITVSTPTPGSRHDLKALEPCGRQTNLNNAASQ